MEYIRPESRLEIRCTFHNKEEPASPSTAPVNPLALGTTPGVSPELAGIDARPVSIAAAVVVGDDPYQSITGIRTPAAATTETAAVSPAGDANGPPLIPSAPVPTVGNGALLNPSPGKATVDE